ncbi:MAG: SAM-dependent chlorinase/fluorinase [Actinomycetota bacterium]
MGQRFHTISFLSDLGVVDEHVGVVKAIVRDLAPHAVVVDLTHQVQAYDVRGGSLALARAIGYVPSGVVLASVDAGPELSRPLVAIEVARGEGVLVGPDNGLLAPAVAMAGGAERAVLLTDLAHHLASAGGVFPTRDVMAPVAAHLCNGVDLAELGELVDADTLLPGVVPLPRQLEGDTEGLIAEVLWVDHAGACQLNIGLDDVSPWALAEGQRVLVVAGDITRVVERVAHAGRLGTGSVGLVVDPYGLLALVLERRSAADELGLAPSHQVTLTPLADGDRGPGSTIPVTLRPHHHDGPAR